jgi:hypothetical protein
MRGFWKTWMTIWCAAVFVFGAVLALGAIPAASGPARLVLSIIGGDPAKAALLDQPIVQFGLGLQGALSIGWAMTMLGLVRAAETVGAPAWRSLTWALVVWYVIDSAISVSTGLPLNAVSNTLLMAGYLAPVLASGVLRSAGRTAMT